MSALRPSVMNCKRMRRGAAAAGPSAVSRPTIRAVQLQPVAGDSAGGSAARFPDGCDAWRQPTKLCNVKRPIRH